MEGRYNLRSPAVKRLMREAQELAEPTEQYYAQPLEDNLFEWHFTIRGPNDSDFSGGIYHGRIILPPDYPMKPPSIMFLTPNGRFDCFTKICLSISKHHPESWQPSWSIRTALLAIIGFMPSPGHGAIGSLDYTPSERSKLSKKSVSYVCEHCGLTSEKVLPLTSASDKTKEEIMNLAAQLSMTAEKAKSSQQPTDESAASAPAESAVSEPADPATDVSRIANIGPLSTPSAPAVSTVSPSAPEITRRPARAGNSPVRRADSSQTLLRRREAPSQARTSRSCFDSVTYWTLIVIGLMLGALVLRRLLKFKYLLGDDL